MNTVRHLSQCLQSQEGTRRSSVHQRCDFSPADCHVDHWSPLQFPAYDCDPFPRLGREPSSPFAFLRLPGRGRPCYASSLATFVVILSCCLRILRSMSAVAVSLVCVLRHNRHHLLARGESPPVFMRDARNDAPLQTQQPEQDPVSCHQPVQDQGQSH